MSSIQPKTIRIPYTDLKSEFIRILIKSGYNDERAHICAEIFATNTLEGVSSHGINRFPRFISNTRDGYIKSDAVPVVIHNSGAIEQWDGNLGPGPVNAVGATDRALDIASEFGIGLVGLANTNHWMRGGTYGWQAARKGYILIAWTNTVANMPAWGAADARLGNNPFVIAVPFKDEAVVLDFAMTQFSYGKLEVHKAEGKKLPFPGGYNLKGNLTDDPGEILASMRAIPIGYWKGAGLSLLLDILAVVLTGGKSVHQITMDKVEYGLSQVFIAIDPEHLKNKPSMESAINQIIEDVKHSVKINKEEAIRYPGQNILKLRNENLKNGIPVNEEMWNKVRQL